jgi:hypothetical protein
MSGDFFDGILPNSDLAAKEEHDAITCFVEVTLIVLVSPARATGGAMTVELEDEHDLNTKFALNVHHPCLYFTASSRARVTADKTPSSP